MSPRLLLRDVGQLKCADVTFGDLTVLVGAHAAAPASVLELCGAPNTQALRRVAETVLKKESRVYLFSRETGTTQEISDLDPGAGDAAEAEWGGLTEFSGRAADVVAEVVAGADPDD